MWVLWQRNQWNQWNSLWSISYSSVTSHHRNTPPPGGATQSSQILFYTQHVSLFILLLRDALFLFVFVCFRGGEGLIVAMTMRREKETRKRLWVFLSSDIGGASFQLRFRPKQIDLQQKPRPQTGHCPIRANVAETRKYIYCLPWNCANNGFTQKTTDQIEEMMLNLCKYMLIRHIRLNINEGNNVIAAFLPENRWLGPPVGPRRNNSLISDVKVEKNR